MTIVRIATLFVSAPTNYYLFCSMIEIATTIFIVWSALKWNNPDILTNEQKK